MKTIKNIFPFFPLVLCIIYVSCGEDNTTNQTTNKLFVTPSRLKTLNAQTEGLYEAWVSFDTASPGFDHNESKFNSMGKFNVDANGSPVDPTTLNAAVFKFKKPYIFDNAKDAIITLEPPNDNDTTPGTVIISGSIAVSSASLDAVLTVQGDDAFGHVGEFLFRSSANFQLNTPTTLDTSDYYGGIWTCDVTGLTSLFDSLLAIPDTLGWKYEGWVVDTTSSPFGYYSTGWFLNPNSADNDGPGSYRGPVPLGTTYNYPGQDWAANNPPITNLRDKQFWITIQPTLGTFTTPFFLRVFQGNIPASATRGQVIALPNVASAYLPSAVIKVLK